MKILLDENFPETYKGKLAKLGHDVQHINKIGKGMTDSEVFAYAQKEKRCLITKDADFKDFLKQPHFGVIKLNDIILNEDILTSILNSLNSETIRNKYVFYKSSKKSFYLRERVLSKKRRIFVQFVDKPLIIA